MRVLGHLGNSLDAFALVRATGADGVELDVHLGGDGALVVHHDAGIEGAGLIADLGAGDLPDSVPLLGAALEACAGMVVNVEIKNLPTDPDYDPTETIVGVVIGAIAGAEVIVSSFSLATIDATKAAAPAVPTAFLTLPRWNQTRALAAAHAHGHDALHPHVRSVDAGLVDAVHDCGMTIHPWGVDDVEAAVAMRRLGVDLIITDDPATVVPGLR